MAESAVFEFVSQQLERLSDMSQVQARGTVRLMLKEAGLNTASVSIDQMKVVVDKLMFDFLTKRKIDSKKAENVCTTIMRLLISADIAIPEAQSNELEEIFKRLDKHS